MSPETRQRSGPERSGSARRRRVESLVVVAAWALFAALYSGATLDERQVYFGGDQADLLAAADDTLHGQAPLIGARSRAGLFHPGPLFVYLLAAVRALAPSREAWTISAVTVLQAASVLFLSFLTLRLSRSLALAISLPYLFAFNFMFLLYLRTLWNVTIVIPALAAAVLLVVKMDPPRPWKLPALAALLSLIAQAHMGFVPVAAWLGAVAIARVLLPSRGIRWRDWLPAVGVLSLAWSPVVWEAVLNRGGNLMRVVARFSTGRHRHSFGEVFTSIDSVLSEVIRGEPGPRVALLVISLTLLAAASLRAGEWAGQLRVLLVAVSGSWVVFVLGVRAVPEPIQTYYLRPVWVLAIATVIGGASALLSLLPGDRLCGVAGLVIATVVVGISIRPALEARRVFAGPDWNSLPLSEARMVVTEIAARSGPREPRRADVEFRLAELGGMESSFLYLLRRLGVERGRSVGAPRFRVEKASKSASLEGGWVRVLQTERYELQIPDGPL